MKLFLNVAGFFSSTMFSFSENKTLKCDEAILHLFQCNVLPMWWCRIHFAWPQTKSLQFLSSDTTEPCVWHVMPSLVITQCCCQKMLAKGTGICIVYHVIPPALPVWGEGHRFVPSQTDILLKQLSGLLAAPQKVILVIWEFLLHLSHILDIERIPGILMSQFLGMRNVKKLKSVCTCKGSLKFVGLEKKSLPSCILPTFMDSSSTA